MKLREVAQRLGGEVLGRDTILCPGPGHSPKDRSLPAKLERNRHGATSLATVAKGVCLHREHYLTS